LISTFIAIGVSPFSDLLRFYNNDWDSPPGSLHKNFTYHTDISHSWQYIFMLYDSESFPQSGHFYFAVTHRENSLA
jgi:hypothetical protein